MKTLKFVNKKIYIEFLIYNRLKIFDKPLKLLTSFFSDVVCIETRNNCFKNVSIKYV
jgi:hypothetical protein